jgi:hypothetical protein
MRNRFPDMMFSCTMGFGNVSGTPEEIAYSLTLYDWTFNVWALYGLLSIIIGYLYYNKGRALKLSSIFPGRTQEWFKNLIDVLMALGIVAGLTTSLGLGVSQLKSGIDYVFMTNVNPYLLMLIVGLVATWSVNSGLKRGVKWLSNLSSILVFILLLVPILITFIVSMADGSGLGVFSVVTASMMLVAALTVVPLISSQKRLMKCILCGVGALLLILFFVNAMNGGGEFFFWSVPTVFGLSVVFFPLVIREMTLPPVLSDKKALIIMIWDTLWLYLTIFTVSYRSGSGSLKTGCIVATVLMIGVWLFFLIIRYLPVNGFIKGGLCTLLCSIWITFSNDVCSYLLYDTRQLTIRHANFSTWTTDLNVNANVYVILLVAGILISALLIGIGIVKKKK